MVSVCDGERTKGQSDKAWYWALLRIPRPHQRGSAARAGRMATLRQPCSMEVAKEPITLRLKMPNLSVSA